MYVEKKRGEWFDPVPTNIVLSLTVHVRVLVLLWQENNVDTPQVVVIFSVN